MTCAVICSSFRQALVTGTILAVFGGPLIGSEPDCEEIRASVRKSIQLVQRSTAEYRQHRSCFSCHHQAMPIIALSEARKRGFAIDETELQTQLQWTADHLKRGKDNYLQGKGQGGQVDTAGYALWALEVGDWKPDDTTAAVIEYLLLRNQELGHWQRSGHRPPSEDSDVTASYLALRGLGAFGGDDQQPRIDARRQEAEKWLLGADGQNTEDRVFRLRALAYLNVEREIIDAAAQALLASQREDGGWPQTSEMESDAYATGTALVSLLRVNAVKATDDAYRKGLAYLIHTQQQDGSWRVISRSKPFQRYFESGFPHGKDQFISMSASCWAITALVLGMPCDGEAKK
jgi:N-acyl-D-amino-acid deacylase